jgi:hypothetical protein
VPPTAANSLIFPPAYNAGYQELLFGPNAAPETSFEYAFRFPDVYPAKWYYTGRNRFEKHFYPSTQEMVFELGLGSTKNLTPYLRSLEQKKLISSKDVLGKMYYLVHDPRVALEHFAKDGTISGQELDSVNELCADLGQPTI